jgi:signal transduction histidine kinase
MPSPRWFRSLYWRIAVGFVLFLAVMLAAQAGIFFLLLSRRIERLPSGTTAEFSRLTAADVSAALQRDAAFDITAFAARSDARRSPPYSIVMRDGRVANTARLGSPPPGFLRTLRRRMDTDAADQLLEPPLPAGGRAVAEPGTGAAGAESGPAGTREAERESFGPAIAPIVVNGRVEGLIVVSPRRPLGVVLTELGPVVVVVAVTLLAIGTAVVSLVVFGPASRRLSSLADAARRLGSGDPGARALEGGGDEVAAVARAFNQMAGDLAARAEEVRASDRARRQLLADVSHELMTPLTAMRGYVETLTMPGLAIDEATRARYLGIVEQETARLERIVQDLLDLARLEDGGGAFEPQDVPVESLFGRVLARHEQVARGRQVALAASIAPGGELAFGDPLRLEQALQNLAANALRHTPAGGTVELRAEPADADGFVLITVHDTGEGIPPEHLASIFDRFYKVDAARGAGAGGSGLGLSIVKAIVERHGGSVRAESAPGAGTTMRVLLPTGPVVA